MRILVAPLAVMAVQAVSQPVVSATAPNIGISQWIRYNYQYQASLFELEGANITWDFSSGILIGSSDQSDEWTTASDLSILASFPSATHLAYPTPGGSYASVWNYGQDSVTILGIWDSGIPTAYENPLVYWKFPLTFGDSIVDVACSNDLCDTSITQYSAYGTLITPFDTLNDAMLVVRYRRNQPTSLRIDFYTSADVYNQVAWFDGFYNGGYRMYFRDGFQQTTSVSNYTYGQSTVCGPNPSKETIMVALSKDIPVGSSYELLNLNGSLVGSGTTKGPTLQIEYPSTGPGMYTLRLSAGEKAQSVRLVFL